jgi:hypothetical protein
MPSTAYRRPLAFGFGSDRRFRNIPYPASLLASRLSTHRRYRGFGFTHKIRLPLFKFGEDHAPPDARWIFRAADFAGR